VLVAWACGEPAAFRPVEVDLQGVSAEAERVVALWFAGEARECTEFRGRDPTELASDLQDEWTAGTAERELRIGRTGSEAAAILFFTEDADGNVLQCACRKIRYADVERPDLVVRLEDGPC